VLVTQPSFQYLHEPKKVHRVSRTTRIKA